MRGTWQRIAAGACFIAAMIAAIGLPLTFDLRGDRDVPGVDAPPSVSRSFIIAPPFAPPAATGGRPTERGRARAGTRSVRAAARGRGARAASSSASARALPTANRPETRATGRVAPRPAAPASPPPAPPPPAPQPLAPASPPPAATPISADRGDDDEDEDDADEADDDGDAEDDD